MKNQTRHKSRMTPEALTELDRRHKAGEDTSGFFDLATGKKIEMTAEMEAVNRELASLAFKLSDEPVEAENARLKHALHIARQWMPSNPHGEEAWRDVATVNAVLGMPPPEENTGQAKLYSPTDDYEMALPD